MDAAAQTEKNPGSIINGSSLVMENEQADVGRLNPVREAKFSGANGDRYI